MVASLRRDPKLEFHALTLSIDQNAVRPRLPTSFSQKLFCHFRIVFVQGGGRESFLVAPTHPGKWQIRDNLFSLEQVLHHRLAIDRMEQRAAHFDIAEPQIVSAQVKPTPGSGTD